MPDDESQAPEGGEDSESDFDDPRGLSDGEASSEDEEDSEGEEDSDTEAARLTQIKALECSLATLGKKDKKQKR